MICVICAFFKCPEGHLGDVVGEMEGLLGHLEAMPSWAILELSWAVLKPSWAVLNHSGPSWSNRGLGSANPFDAVRKAQGLWLLV